MIAASAMAFAIGMRMIAASAPPVAASVQSPAAPQDITHLRWVTYWAAGGRDGQRVWDQLRPYEGPNGAECPSGCGGAAWAILFGWADYRASLGDPSWINQWGLYRQNGGVATANVVAPRYMRAAGDAGGALTAEGSGVANMLMEIRSDIHTFCFTSAGGATTPWDMDGAFRYADRRRYARIYASAEHNWFNNEWSHVWNQLRYRRTPSVIMTGSLGDGTLHYPVAFGARGELVRDCGWDWGVNWPWGGTRCEEKLRNTSFYINPGWGSSTHFAWVPASTGFYTVMEPR
jgi:hypothetical protein